ncbi:MAG: hypothetical protein HFJ81_01010 [Clostridia bacterium]|nr:hypothetical protein [Clostridia bacterium]
MKKIIGIGRSLWDFIKTGEALLLDDNISHSVEHCRGKILITHIPSPDIVLYMREALAIVAETGGILCHAAVLALELGCPIIVAAEGVKSKISNGEKIILESLSGEGRIYAKESI